MYRLCKKKVVVAGFQAQEIVKLELTITESHVTFYSMQYIKNMVILFLDYILSKRFTRYVYNSSIYMNCIFNFFNSIVFQQSVSM